MLWKTMNSTQIEDDLKCMIKKTVYKNRAQNIDTNSWQRYFEDVCDKIPAVHVQGVNMFDVKLNKTKIKSTN